MCRPGSRLSLLVVIGGLLLASSARATDLAAAACLAASNASIKADNEHRLRDERVELLTCAAASCPADIRNECIRRVDEANLAIPTILFDVKDEAGNDLSAVRISMGAEVLANWLDGIAIPIDPGAHTFVFEVAGRPTVRKQLVIRQGQKNRSESITFAAAALRPAGAAQAEQPNGVRVRPAPDALSSSSSSRASESAGSSGVRRTVAIVAATLGVVGVGAGAFFGWQALKKRDDARKVCPNVCGDQDSVVLWQDAKRAGNLSTGAFVVGGVGLATAALLWLTASPETTVAPSAEVGLGYAAVGLGGRW